MIGFSETWQPAVAAGLALYGVAWLVWRCLLSSAHPYAIRAEKRARLLLSEFLTDEEEQQLDQAGRLLVQSPHWPDRIYSIQGDGRWVDVYDFGKLSMRMCAGAQQGASVGDALLMHKFMIEGDENEYLRSASVQWQRAAGDDERGWCHVANSSGRSTAMIARLEGGQAASGGVYWSFKDGEFISVPREGGTLESGPGRTYVKVPLPIVLVVGPIMGMAFAFFLPLSGVLVLASLAKKKLQGAASAGKVGAAGMARMQMQPGASYLHTAGKPSADSSADSDAEADGKLVDLAKEIAEKRWREKQ